MLDARCVLGLALASVLTHVTPAGQGDGVLQSDALYPAVKVEQVVRFATVKTDEPDLGELA